jgi:putative MFS transporter
MATISQRIESIPMTRTTWVILMLVGVGWMFDAMDQGMVSGVIAAIGTDWDLSKY